MISQYGQLSSGFIRRRIAQHHFRASNRDAEQWDDDRIDEQIDQQVRILKTDRRDQQTWFPDEIYIECLIRTDFVIQQALKMFNDNRPILVRCFSLYLLALDRYLSYSHLQTPPDRRNEPTQKTMSQLAQPSAEAIQRHANALRNSPVTSDANDDHVRYLV